MPDLPDPWFHPTDAQGQALLREALAEIGLGHALAEHDLVPVAACSGCDRVVFRVDDGTFAIVHLTWTGHPDAGGLPATRRMQTVVALREAVSEHRH